MSATPQVIEGAALDETTAEIFRDIARKQARRPAYPHRNTTYWLYKMERPELARNYRRMALTKVVEIASASLETNNL